MEIQTIEQYRNRLAAKRLKHIRNTVYASEFLEYLEELLEDDENDLIRAIDAFFEEIQEKDAS